MEMLNQKQSWMNHADISTIGIVSFQKFCVSFYQQSCFMLKSRNAFSLSVQLVRYNNLSLIFSTPNNLNTILGIGARSQNFT